MELVKIWWTVFSIIITAIVGYLIKKIPRWYKHYKGNRDQWQIFLQSSINELKKDVIQVKDQNDYLKKEVADVKKDVVDVKYQVYPNGGNSLKDDVAVVLSNMAITKGLLDATLYLDDTPTFKCDMKGNCFFVNVAWLELFGFNNPDEAYGKGWYKTIHPPDKEEVKQEFEDAVTNETIFIKKVNKQHLVTQTVIPVKMMTKIIRDHNKKAIEIVGQLKTINK